MTATSFARALPRVLAHEGGYANHPADPGDVTLEGVIQRTYDASRRRKGLPTRPLTPAMRGTVEWKRERDEIYRLQYWDKVAGDDLPAGVDYVLFDGAVNSGPVQSIKWAQRAVGLRSDGVMGQQTIDALNEHPNKAALIDAICDRRLAFLKALGTWGTFGRGWSSRVAGVRTTAKAWASGRILPAPPSPQNPSPRGRVSDASKPPSKAPADAAIGGGSVSGGLAETVRQTRESLEPLAGSTTVNTIIATLAILGIVLVAGGLAYRWWANRKAKQRAEALDLVPEGE